MNDDFYKYQEPSINIYSFFVADQDTARDSIYMFSTGKCVSLAEPFDVFCKRQFIQFVRIPA